MNQVAAVNLQSWYAAVLVRPLMPYQLEMVRRLGQAGTKAGRMVFLPARRFGWAHARNALANIWASDTYPAKHGEPWAVVMRAPSHVRPNSIIRALRTVTTDKGEVHA